MSTETKACIRGCMMYRRHLDECEGVADESCRGCLPQRAHHGLLCGTCFRRFELMLTDSPTVYRWLTGNLSAGQGQAPDDVRITSGGNEAPIPIKAAVFDTRQQLSDQLAAWVDDFAEGQKLAKPARPMDARKGVPLYATVDGDAAFLLRWINSLVWCEWIGDWWQELAETMSEAHALAPWRPKAKRVGTIPCPECAEVNLMIFGGESDITCGSCRLMIPERAFGLWELAVRAEHGIEATG